MQITIVFSIPILCILLACSACFSASETSIFSLSSLNMAEMETTHKAAFSRLRYLLENPRFLLITILFGNTLVNILFFSVSTVMSFIVAENYGPKAVFIGEILSLSAVILFGEVVPKAVAIKKPVSIAQITSIFILLVFKVFRPIIGLLDKVTKFFCLLVKADKKEKSITIEDIKLLLSMSEQEGIINQEEYEMLKDTISLHDIQVKEIMTPRVDMVKAFIDSKPSDILYLFARHKVPLLTIYGTHSDDIRGLLYAKEFFIKCPQTIESLVHKIPFIPKNMNVERLMLFFQSQNKRAAFVLDEYGGVEGLVTFDSIIKVLGEAEIQEYDAPSPVIIKVSENCYQLSGRLPVKEFCDFFHVPEPACHCDTISGLITFLLQTLPEKGDKVEYQGLVLEVLAVQNRRVMEILVIEASEVNNDVLKP